MDPTLNILNQIWEFAQFSVKCYRLLLDDNTVSHYKGEAQQIKATKNSRYISPEA